MKRKLRVQIISESEGFEAQGVHTAFVDMIEMLSKRRDLELEVNSRVQCDVLHAHTFGPRYWRAMASYPGRRIVTAHVVPNSMKGSLWGWRWWGPLFNQYMKWAYNSATMVQAVAPQVKRDLEELGVRSRIEVLTNPVNHSRFFPSVKDRREGRKLLKLKAKDKACIGVGQVQPRKGIEDFIEAARSNPGVKFIWVGGRPFGALTDAYGPLNRAIEKAPANVIFPGTFKLNQMRALYNASDLFFFPSIQENCALAINEAAACGVPMLLRDNPEHGELYGRKRYLAARDGKGFGKQVKAFFGSAKLRADYKKRALSVAKDFGAEKFATILAGLYYKVYEAWDRR